MTPEQRKYIQENSGRLSIKQLAEQLGVKERKVKKFLEKSRQENSSSVSLADRSSFSGSGPLSIFSIMIIFAGVIVYANSFLGAFVFDDHHVVLNNHRIASWPLWMFLKFPRSLVEITFAINFAIGKQNPQSYHFINLLIHISAALTLFGIVWRTLSFPGLKERYGAYAKALGLSVALIWLVHPLQTQSVTYISQRYESLAGFFYLYTLYSLIRYSTDNQKRTKWFFLTVFSAVLGMISKETMVTAPVVIFIYDRIFLAASFKEILKKRWKVYLGLIFSWGVLALSWAWTIFVLSKAKQTGYGGAGFDIEEVTFWQYLMSQPGVLLYYLKLSFWPHPLCFDYNWPIASGLRETVPALMGIGTLFTLTMVFLKINPPIGFLGIWFFVILAPSSSIMPIKDLIFEHRMYLSLASVIALTVLACYEGIRRFDKKTHASRPEKNQIGIILLLLTVVCFGFVTMKRNMDYRTHIDFMKQNISVRPDNARLYINLGKLYMDEGNFAEAERAYLEGLKVAPDYDELYSNLASTLIETGKYDEALQHVEKALELSPDFSEAYHNLGVIYLKQQKMKEAVAAFTKAINLDPEMAASYYSLGTIYASRKQYNEAKKHLYMAIEQEPRYISAYYYLGNIALAENQLKEAAGYFQEAMKINPHYKDVKSKLARTLKALKQPSSLPA